MTAEKKAKYARFTTMVANTVGAKKHGVLLTHAEPSGEVLLYANKPNGERGALLYRGDPCKLLREALEHIGMEVEEQLAE